MEVETPAKVPGSVLAAERDTYGVLRSELAEKMGLHRNTLMIWESPDTQVDVIRQARYRKALRALVAEKLAAESKR